MNTKVTNAVERLNEILPLTKRRQGLSKELSDMYRNILSSYVDRGKTLNKDEIARQVSDLDESIRILRDNDMVIFDTDGEPVGACPFTMEQREHEVSVNGHTVHCMCALDPLADAIDFAAGFFVPLMTKQAA